MTPRKRRATVHLQCAVTRQLATVTLPPLKIVRSQLTHGCCCCDVSVCCAAAAVSLSRSSRTMSAVTERGVTAGEPHGAEQYELAAQHDSPQHHDDASEPALHTEIAVSDAVPAVVTSAPADSLWQASFAAMKKQLVPGLVLQAVALVIILVYYTSDSARASFDDLAELKERGGFFASGISTCLAGGVLPTLMNWARQAYAQRKLQRAAELTQGLDLQSVAAPAPAPEPEPVAGANGHTLVESDDLLAGVAPVEFHDGRNLDGSRVDGSGVTVAEAPLTKREEMAFALCFWFWHGSAQAHTKRHMASARAREREAQAAQKLLSFFSFDAFCLVFLFSSFPVWRSMCGSRCKLPCSATTTKWVPLWPRHSSISLYTQLFGQ